MLSAWGGFKNRLLTSLVALIFAGGATLLVGLAPANMYLLAVAGMAIFGFMNPIINGPIFAVMQAKVEPDIQGRVFSFLTAGAGFASPLGLAIAGPVADATSNQLWFILGGIITMIAGIAALFIPKMRELDKDSAETPDPVIVESTEADQA